MDALRVPSRTMTLPTVGVCRRERSARGTSFRTTWFKAAWFKAGMATASSASVRRVESCSRCPADSRAHAHRRDRPRCHDQLKDHSSAARCWPLPASRSAPSMRSREATSTMAPALPAIRPQCRCRRPSGARSLDRLLPARSTLPTRWATFAVPDDRPMRDRSAVTAISTTMPATVSASATISIAGCAPISPSTSATDVESRGSGERTRTVLNGRTLCLRHDHRCATQSPRA